MKKKDIIGVVGILIMLMALYLAGTWIFINRPDEYNRQTLCSVRIIPRSNEIIIVDKTDPIPPLDLNNLRQIILEIRDRLRVQDRIWLFIMLSSGVDISNPLFSRCRPESGADVSSLNHDPDQIQKQYMQSFEVPLSQALYTLLSAQLSEESPILETLGRISRSEAFGKDGSRHITLITDLLQNSPLFSTYGAAWNHRPTPKALSERMILDYGPVFSQVDLSVFVIDRNLRSAPRQQILREYWTAIFNSMGFTRVNIRTL